MYRGQLVAPTKLWHMSQSAAEGQPARSASSLELTHGEESFDAPVNPSSSSNSSALGDFRPQSAPVGDAVSLRVGGFITGTHARG